MTPPLFAYVAAFSYAAPTLSGFIRYKSLDRPRKIFLICLCAITIEVGIEYAFLSIGLNNLFIVNWGSLFETSLTALVFIAAARTLHVRRLYMLLLLLFLCCWFAVYLFAYEPMKVNAVMIVLARICIIIYSVHFFHIFLLRSEANLLHEPMFWIAAGNILYSTITAFAIGLSGELMRYGHEVFLTVWNINWGMIVISNALYVRSFFCPKKT